MSIKNPTLETFQLILVSKLTQFDVKLYQRQPNPYRLAHFLEAAQGVESLWRAAGHVQADRAGAVAFEEAVAAWFDRRGAGGSGFDLPPVRETIKQLWAYVDWAGRDLFDLAPRTSAKARKSARELARELEKLNSYPLDAAYERAAAMQGRHYREPTPEGFGYALAMEALGHGVAWSDDHPDHGLRLPHWSFYM